MTLRDVAELTLLSWDTVKTIVKAQLAQDCGKPFLKGVRYLGIDEIHVGKKGRFYTLVLDLEDGRILWAKPGRGGAEGTRFLLLRNSENLPEDQIPKLERALQLNEPLLPGWYLKEELRELWNQPSRQKMAAFLKDWCQKAGQTAIGQLMKMAKTLRTDASGILAYARHPITSGKLEGINNKIKTLTKRFYGFHDANFFILKLLSLHRSKYKLVG